MPITTPWASYTPGWLGTTTDPVLGNGTLDFRYRRLDGAFLWSLNLIVGSTTTFGSGNWCFHVGLAATWPIFSRSVIDVAAAPAVAFSNAYTPVATGVAPFVMTDPTTLGIPGVWPFTDYLWVLPLFNTTRVSPTSPVTWASGYRLSCGNALEAFDN